MSRNSKNPLVRAAVRERSRTSVFLTAVALYVLGMIFGSAFIVCVPSFKYHDALLTIARDRGSYTLTHFVDYPYPTFGTEYYLYRSDGDLIVREQLFLPDKEIPRLTELMPELMEKGHIYKLRRFPLGEEGKRNGKVFCILAGCTVENDRGLRFGSLIVRDLNDINIFLVTFAGIYTLIFAAALFLLLRISHQQDELLKLQRDLVSNVSHELKTPITSIKAMAELLHDGMYETEEDMKHYTASILTESDRLKELVKEILELSKIQNHKAELKKEKCFAEALFAPVVDRYMMLCGDLGITLDTSELALNELPPLYTDPKYITRVMNILLENAVKFVGSGGRIEMGVEKKPHCAMFWVRDNGPGIDSKDIDRIFERFYKSDLTHNSQGSGLGLSIAAETIKGLGEKIGVQSTLGVGSQFFFTVEYK